jgi:hypothetical protein
MRCIWFCIDNLPSTEVVKLKDSFWVLRKRSGCADFLNAVTTPKTVFVAKSLETRLTRYSRAGKGDYMHDSIFAQM